MKKICDKNMSFEECELAVLRVAVDKAVERDKENVNTPEIKEMIKIVEKFIKDDGCICYGGTAINNILPKKDQFYNYEEEIPDYDFFSPTPIEHAKKLVDIYLEAGYVEVEAKSGVHYGTYKVYVNFIPMADITLLEKSLFDVLKENCIKKLGINYCPPNYLRMSMYLELSRPRGDISRWEKVLKRLTLLNKYFPIKDDTCNYENFQRKYEGDNKDIDIINEIIRTASIDTESIFFGGYANFLYSKYMPYNIRKKFTKDPDFDILSDDPEILAELIKEGLEDNNFKKVSVIKHKGLQDILSDHYEIKIGLDSVCYIYSPSGCHSYNKITINGDSIRVATIDTMLSFYLAFMFINRDYYDPKRILCMSKFLFDVQQRNRLKQKGLLKRFSIDCYGKQHSLGDIRETKAKKFKELKRTSPEYEAWFLKYRPGDKLKDKKNSNEDNKNTNNSNEKKVVKKKIQKKKSVKKKTQGKKTRKSIFSLYQ